SRTRGASSGSRATTPTTRRTASAGSAPRPSAPTGSATSDCERRSSFARAEADHEGVLALATDATDVDPLEPRAHLPDEHPGVRAVVAVQDHRAARPPPRPQGRGQPQRPSAPPDV